MIHRISKASRSAARHVKALYLRAPWFMNEGEATCVAIDYCFDGFPLEKNFESKEDAVAMLAHIWNTLDDWDGSRSNVAMVKAMK